MLKPVLFVICVIIMVIPSKLCFTSFITISMVFLHDFPSFSTISFGFFTVSSQCFSCFLFQILRIDAMVLIFLEKLVTKYKLAVQIKLDNRMLYGKHTPIGESAKKKKNNEDNDKIQQNNQTVNYHQLTRRRSNQNTARRRTGNKNILHCCNQSII